MEKAMRQIPPRPTATRQMILECCKPIAKKLEADAETLAHHYNRHMDGFELCIELAKWAGWDMQREDIDILDELDFLVDEAERKAVRAWFEEHNPQPPFAIGDSIKGGVITGISTYSPACFEVKIEGEPDTTRRIIKFEDAIAA
ncbi:hypothetical protein [Pseudomonas mosselii]|uniref:hypothetical protein n=1 Tax=Pseudomonas mosselii TaxID=78327 RepID=UPI002022BC3F|nr:hypothetical protein [Pseudomonas mosselii]MCL8299423.1 hypothetical protein [Pseudomonas mosselii]MCL8339720.1 hypothetical protein [Pseudomonas mosselii]MCU9528788.1 hypothetical protein [Pseudomonas mosselii]MCU9536123.1 hypothetical protein [Pseudomonas mosselii]MCU9541758.1 hypothetical protein [Pseudomonas mosselii]